MEHSIKHTPVRKVTSLLVPLDSGQPHLHINVTRFSKESGGPMSSASQTVQPTDGSVCEL